VRLRHRVAERIEDDEESVSPLPGVVILDRAQLRVGLRVPAVERVRVRIGDVLQPRAGAPGVDPVVADVAEPTDLPLVVAEREIEGEGAAHAAERLPLFLVDPARLLGRLHSHGDLEGDRQVSQVDHEVRVVLHEVLERDLVKRDIVVDMVVDPVLQVAVCRDVEGECRAGRPRRVKGELIERLEVDAPGPPEEEPAEVPRVRLELRQFDLDRGVRGGRAERIDLRPRRAGRPLREVVLPGGGPVGHVAVEREEVREVQRDGGVGRPSEQRRRIERIRQLGVELELHGRPAVAAVGHPGHDGDARIRFDHLQRQRHGAEAMGRPEVGADQLVDHGSDVRAHRVHGIPGPVERPGALRRPEEADLGRRNLARPPFLGERSARSVEKSADQYGQRLGQVRPQAGELQARVGDRVAMHDPGGRVDERRLHAVRPVLVPDRKVEVARGETFADPEAIGDLHAVSQVVQRRHPANGRLGVAGGAEPERNEDRRHRGTESQGSMHSQPPG